MAVTRVRRFMVDVTCTENTPTDNEMSGDLLSLLVDPERKMARPGWMVSADRVQVVTMRQLGVE